MSDEKLRALERRWKETGAIDDEAAWLVKRIRAGTEANRPDRGLRRADALGGRLTLSPARQEYGV